MRKKSFFRGVLSTFLAVILVFLAPVSTYALSEAQLNMFSQNNILFYDPNGGECKSGYAVKPTGDKITWIGDSYSYINKEQIKNTFPGVDIDNYVKSSKWFEKDNDENSGGKGGLTILQEIKDAGELRDYLVFALGTNGSITEDQMDKLMDIAGPNTNVVVATLRTRNASYDSSNTAINSAKAKYKNLYVADWDAVAKDHLDDWFADGIHPTQGEAVDKWIELIKNALPETYSSDGVIGSVESGTYLNTNPFDYTGPNPYSHWTGGCTDASIWEEFLESQNEFVRTAAAEKGLPWEAMLAQAILESGGGISSVAQSCKNPLGLKGSGTAGICGGYAGFNSFEDAWKYYMDRVISVRNAQGKFSNSPFSFLEFIQYGVDRGTSYAQCDNIKYTTGEGEFSCGGHQLGDPTPSYVNTASNIVCGIQKWAIEKNIPISEENYSNFDSPFITERPDGTVPIGATAGGTVCRGHSGVVRNNGDINTTALALAWPLTASGYRDAHGPYSPSEAYKAALTELGWYDNANGENYADECTKKGGSCDVFVATAMRYSGADPNFPIYLGTQRGYLGSHPELYDVYDAGSVEPQPGDIRIENGGGHIVLIVRLPNGNLGVASASHCDRSGDLVGYYYEPGTIYRYKGH